MSKEVCSIINTIDDKVSVNANGLIAMVDFNEIHSKYCDSEEGGFCYSYEAIVSSVFTKILKHFESCNDDDNLENAKLAQYAILWLCHKLNKNSQNVVSNLKDIYDVYIKDYEKDIEKISGADAYNSCKDIINKKIYSMRIDIKEMSKLYEALKTLCKLYTECNGKKQNCTKCLQHAEEFVKSFGTLNNDYNHKKGSFYSQILSTLSKDYNKLKEECDNGQSKKFPSLPPIKPTKSYTHTYGETDIQFSEVETSSSSIASKLIPGLLVFTIPIFLGIAYKYSLFGFGKRSQKQYLRKMLKK
ncbi:CIR protein [Plasmodium chabaudi chabaudi]|uniref:CIR protein n=1 Tax=Plasmodium chabaudi chabaudi TaxID=31271 RepID=A0A4V0JZI9_PLACU|nr:CIR protein [Plasmodium chabaudi chabaudi]VTZ66182.1 CIR protein [Plasmodium chabaudi chabaudi]|eukprot:XP_016652956.1 CIR protein [Plasmodium chabaudi chabaudi]